MDTIDNIMALADEYADEKQISARFSSGGFYTKMCAQMEVINKRAALRTALTELVSTATEYQQAADKMPEPDLHCFDAESELNVCSYTEEMLKQYGDDRAREALEMAANRVGVWDKSFNTGGVFAGAIRALAQ